MIYLTADTYFIIFSVIVITGCMVYAKAMVSMIISRTLIHHTNKAPIYWWAMQHEAMKCIIRNPYKKDKIMAEYVRKARIAVGIMAIIILIILILPF